MSNFSIYEQIVVATLREILPTFEGTLKKELTSITSNMAKFMCSKDKTLKADKIKKLMSDFLKSNIVLKAETTKKEEDEKEEEGNEDNEEEVNTDDEGEDNEEGNEEEEEEGKEEEKAEKTEKKEKKPRKINEAVVSEGIVLVEDYTKKGIAIFGETDSIEDELKGLKHSETNKPIFKKNKNLAYGPGWIAAADNKDAINDFFESQSIEVEVVSRSDMEKRKKGEQPEEKKEVKKVEVKKVEVKEVKKVEKKADVKKEVKKVEVKEVKKVEKKADVKKVEKKEVKVEEKKPEKKAEVKKEEKKEDTEKIVCQKNKWDNFEHAETGVIFYKLPVGVNSRVVDIAIGTQDIETKDKGIKSVNALDEESIKVCQSYKWKVLTKDMVEKIKKTEKALGTALEGVLKRVPKEEQKEEVEAEEEPVEVEEDVEEDEDKIKEDILTDLMKDDE